MTLRQKIYFCSCCNKILFQSPLCIPGCMRSRIGKEILGKISVTYSIILQKQTNPISIITKCLNPHKTIKCIVEKYWHILTLNATIGPFVPHTPSFTFRGARSLRDQLVSSEFRVDDREIPINVQELSLAVDASPVSVWWFCLYLRACPICPSLGAQGPFTPLVMCSAFLTGVRRPDVSRSPWLWTWHGDEGRSYPYVTSDVCAERCRVPFSSPSRWRRHHSSANRGRPFNPASPYTST